MLLKGKATGNTSWSTRQVHLEPRIARVRYPSGSRACGSSALAV